MFLCEVNDARADTPVRNRVPPALFTAREAIVHVNFRAGSKFPVPVCTVPSSMDRTSRCGKVDAVRLYASYKLNLLLLKGQRCVKDPLDKFYRNIILKLHYTLIFV